MTQPRKNFPHAPLCAAALLLWCAYPQSSRGQTPAGDLQAGLAGTKSPQDAIDKGLLFYATAPVSEEALKRLDGTPNEQSFTVPLTVDRVHNRLYVQARLNNKNVRLILDTGGGPSISLDKAAAREVGLADQFPQQVLGSQGNETDTAGLARSLTLGNLMLRQAFVTVSPTDGFNFIGTYTFKHYRVTLDFQAQTMTLTRGGILTTPPGGASVTLPFDDDDGDIFVPAHVLNQDGWALLDSGSDVTEVSLKSAQAAAAQFPAADSKTVVTDKRVGVGSTAKKTTFVKLAVPVPISLNTTSQDSLFSTTTQIGGSDIDTVLDAGLGAGGNMNALLGFPFFLQFQRVIIDYPAHTLVLQYPVKDTPLRVTDFLTKHDRAWPGYKWLQKGYGWIEVPDGTSSPASAPPPAAVQTTGTIVTGGGTVVTMGSGSVTVTSNGVTKTYPMPPGSGVAVNRDGSVQISPPASRTPSSPIPGMTKLADGTNVVSDSVIVNGTVPIDEALTVNGVLTVNGALTVGKAITVNGALIVNGNFTARQALTVNGSVTVNGSATVNKVVAVNGAMTVNSAGTTMTMISGSVTVTANGVTKVYPAPPGSGITVNPDGSVQILPPRTANPAH